MEQFIYCQPLNCKSSSCGACCGMYNWKNCSRELVKEVLEFQTDAFLKSDRTEEDLLKLRKEIAKKRPPVLFPVIYNCEFLGFIDPVRKKVGCLLHPEVNQGKNLRGISPHGRELCDESRCTVYFYLNDSEVNLIAQTLEDWYLYGLCVTDLDLIKEFFELASKRVADYVKPEAILGDKNLQEIFREYLRLKEHWPFARSNERLGKYYFQDDKYFIHQIDYKSLSSAPSIYDKILVSLGSEFKNPKELAEAENLLEQIFKKFSENW